MPVYDFECQTCGKVEELILPVQDADKTGQCSECGGNSRHIITMSGVHMGNNDAPWIRSVLEVVDKTSDKPHVREFIKNPTRRNYKQWMKKEGLRPLAPGERTKPPPVDMSGVQREMWRRHQERNKIEIKGR